MKVLYRRLIISLMVIACLIVPFAVVSNAHSIADIYTDIDTGWQKWENRHMGSKYTTFSYGNGLTDYYDEIQAGISMWGSYINFTQATNAMGQFLKSDSVLDDYVAVTNSSTALNGHVTSWTITISQYYFNQEIARNNGAVVIAHEIGHVYGLNHGVNEFDIMYDNYNGRQRVTSIDKLGMNFMTHTHVHNDETTYVLDQHSVAQHKKRCNVCRAFYLENCTYSSHYHSGNYHYFQMNCSCGNNGVKQISCSPLNCPYSGGQIM